MKLTRADFALLWGVVIIAMCAYPPHEAVEGPALHEYHDAEARRFTSRGDYYGHFDGYRPDKQREGKYYGWITNEGYTIDLSRLFAQIIGVTALAVGLGWKFGQKPTAETA
jgi:hypothetical protein